LADLLAFYSRRDGLAVYTAKKKGRETYKIDMMVKIITENFLHRHFVATDFGPGAE
jgi:hypothetical protein